MLAALEGVDFRFRRWAGDRQFFQNGPACSILKRHRPRARGRYFFNCQCSSKKSEAAIFPGDLSNDPNKALDGRLEGHLKFLRFRPPLHKGATFPHIRLDRAIEFLIGDRLS